MANTERLKELRAFLTERPEQHRQRSWATRPAKVEGSCGTTMCMAGAAAVLGGHELDWANAEHSENINGVLHVVASRVTNGQYIEDVAAEWLELDRDDANTLFFTMDNASALELLDELIETGSLD